MVTTEKQIEDIIHLLREELPKMQFGKIVLYFQDGKYLHADICPRVRKKLPAGRKSQLQAM